MTYARLVGCDFHVTKHCLENGPAKFGSTDQQIHSLHIRDEIRRDVPAWAINHSSADFCAGSFGDYPAVTGCQLYFCL